MYERPLLTYPLIEKAVSGDPEAVYEVLGYYSGYISALSREEAHSTREGRSSTAINEDLRQTLESKLLSKIFAFDLSR